MEVRLLHDRILIKRLEEENLSEGGIILTGDSVEKSSQGIIVSIADGVELQTGTNVIFGDFIELTHNIDNEEYLIMREENVLAVVE